MQAVATQVPPTSASPGGDAGVVRTESVGFVGLGAMGVAMARNLQLRLHAGGDQAVRRSLLLYNRSPDKAAPLLADSSLGCSLAGSLADVAQCCSIICLMLIDDDACEAVLTQLLAAPGGLQGKVVVNHSTSSPDWTRRAAARAEAQGASYVAAPVWGRPDAAAASSLIVAAGGDASAVARVTPFLATHGRLLPPLDDPVKAAMFKLAGNFSLYGLVEVMCEALTLCDATGIPRDAFLAFTDAFYACRPIQGYAQRAATEAVEDGVAVELALKDVRYVRQLADASRCPLPVADTVFNSLLSATANGCGRKDIASIFLMMQRAAGRQPASLGGQQQQEPGSQAPPPHPN